jgi:hypothetical protein
MARIRQEEADLMRGKAKRPQLAIEQIATDATVGRPAPDRQHGPELGLLR